MKKILMTAAVTLAALTGLSAERRMVWTRPFQLRDSVGGGFEGAAKALKANGITDVICCLTDGPFARFPSKAMLPDPELAKYAEPDPLTPMLKALHAEGIRLHAWMALGRLARADAATVAKFEKEGRLSLGLDCKPNKEKFLCREDPRNIEMYRAAAAELIARGIDGIHLDYIRYAHWSDCYCERFKKLYAARGGQNLANWPKGVDGNKGIDPVWVETRTAVIDGIVKTMREEVRKHQGVEFSAAVFDQPATVKVLLGQDWPRWAKEGWLDFVCPMDYTADIEDLRRELLEEMPIAAGAKTKIYPGLAIGWSGGENKSKVLKEQIEMVRTYEPGGFVVFYWSRDTAGRIISALSE